LVRPLFIVAAYGDLALLSRWRRRPRQWL